MPRILDHILKCTAYLYASERDARSSTRQGGTCFFVGVPGSDKESTEDVYVITNSHVIDDGFTHIRVNTRDNRFDVIEVDNWVVNPNGDDVAVGTVASLDAERHDVEPISTDLFLTEQLLKDWCVGPGDETFTVGRFINHEGQERNLPSVRFGNISMLPYEGVRYGNANHDAYLVESRSVPGYSGSPTFLQILPMSWRPCRPRGRTSLSTLSVFLLGVDMGVLPPRPEGRNEYTGMMVVIPVWKLQEILDLPQLAK